MTPSSLIIAACGLLLCASVASAADAPGELAAVRAEVASALDRPCLIVTGTVVTLVDGRPLSTSTFTGRFKKPAGWLITWQDAGIGTFKPTGTVWGDGAQSHLRFTGGGAVQTTTDAEMTIAAATGISHSIAPWLHGLFHGRPGAVLADDGVVSQAEGKTIVTVEPHTGRSTRVTISHHLITGAETITDSAKLGPVPKLDEAQIIKVIETRGEKATPEKIAELREMFAKAQASMAASTSVFTERYVFQWQLDGTVSDAQLMPEPVPPEAK